MSKKLLGGSGALIAVVIAGVVIWQSCKLAVTHKSLASVCTFSNQIRNSIGMLTMGAVAPTKVPGMLNNPVVNKSCLCMGGKFVGTCDLAGQPCTNAPMMMGGTKKTPGTLPGQKSLMGVTLSRMAGAFDDDIL